jgi:hypothetical protein
MNPTPSVPNAAGSSSRVRLEGTLDMVQASDSNFRFRLDDGRIIPGQLVGRPIITLAKVLGRRLLVFGTGHFTTAGEMERIEMDSFIPNDGQPWTISSEDMPLSEEVRMEQARRLRASMDRWPGDETDEQIEAALKELG